MLTCVSDAVCVDRVDAVFELADTEMGMADVLSTSMVLDHRGSLALEDSSPSL